MKDRKYVASEVDDQIVIGIPFRIPREHRARILAYANAANHGSVADWFAWLWNDCAYTEEELQREIDEMLEDSPIEAAVRVFREAGDTCFGLFDDDPSPDVDGAGFVEMVRAWASPNVAENNGITPQEQQWLVEVAEAALALDGAKARRVAEHVHKAWDAVWEAERLQIEADLKSARP